MASENYLDMEKELKGPENKMKVQIKFVFFFI